MLSKVTFKESPGIYIRMAIKSVLAVPVMQSEGYIGNTTNTRILLIGKKGTQYIEY